MVELQKTHLSGRTKSVYVISDVAMGFCVYVCGGRARWRSMHNSMAGHLTHASFEQLPFLLPSSSFSSLPLSLSLTLSLSLSVEFGSAKNEKFDENCHSDALDRYLRTIRTRHIALHQITFITGDSVSELAV